VAARVRKIRHDENTRQKIRVAKYLNILDECADGKRKLDNSQIKSIEILLAKSLPSLQSVEISGEITTSKVIRTPTISTDNASWLQQHGEPNASEKIH